MSATVTGTLAKLQNLLPNRIGDNATYSTEYVTDLIMAGFHEVAERCDLVNLVQYVSLANDTLIYDISDYFVEITSVDFYKSGTTIDGHLRCVTLSDLDRFSRKWRDDRGTRPEYYTLLSAPGIPESSSGAEDGSKILIWRPMSSVSSDQIKISGKGIGVEATKTPEDVQRLCLVPYVLAHLKAVQNPQQAIDYYSMFLNGCDRVRGRYGVNLTETPTVGRK